MCASEGIAPAFRWQAIRVPRYHFDMYDNRSERDESETECVDYDDARLEAMNMLSDIARWEIPSDGDKQIFTMMVRNDVGVPIYEATLTLIGVKLDKCPVKV